MKTLISIITIVSLFAFTGCDKDNCQMATISRDCTGTYLEIKGSDYFVCNPSKISGMADNSSICVEYTLCEECDDGMIHCTMARPFDGRLIIKGVNTSSVKTEKTNDK